MATSVTVAQLRAQVSPVLSKLCPLAEAHKSQLDLYYLSNNCNPMALDYILRNPKVCHMSCVMFGLSRNPVAIAFLETHKDMIIPIWLFQNPNLSKDLFDTVLKEKPTAHYYELLYCNPSDVVVDYLLKRPDKIEWYYFSKNTNERAVAYLKKNEENINWSCLSGNTSNGAICLLKENRERIDFDQLSLNSNPKAFELLLTFPDDCINYNNLSANTNPKAVAYLIQNRPDEIKWCLFSKNPTAMPYLVANPEKVHFQTLWENPAIFQIDEQAVCKERSDIMKPLLLSIFMDPDRVDRLREKGVSFKEIVDNL
jgi:hypothetical protein